MLTTKLINLSDAVSNLFFFFFKSDFELLLPELNEKIESCDFCAIDCELSGITNYKNLNAFDSAKIRYEKMKKVKKAHSKTNQLLKFTVFLLNCRTMTSFLFFNLVFAYSSAMSRKQSPTHMSAVPTIASYFRVRKTVNSAKTWLSLV